MEFVGLTAYIVDCCRTAGGRRNGRLKNWHPADLGGAVLDAILDRNPSLPPEAVDDVIFGCVAQNGIQGANIGRGAVLSSRLPESVPGVAIDRQCGSSQQSIHFAAQAVMSGVNNVVIAGGVEIMSTTNFGGFQKGKKMIEKYETDFSQFLGAELLSRKYNLAREELDKFAVTSHQKAIYATDHGHFKKEIIPVEGWDKKRQMSVEHQKDEGIRRGTTLEKTVKLKPLQEGGIITAATSSQICDGASAVLICNERALKRYKLTPRAKIIGMTLAGSDPVLMLEGPIHATKKAFKQTGLTIDDMDLYEVNEAFAPVPLAWLKALGGDLQKMNVNGGAMALGHPLGATGCKLMATLVCELERRKSKRGVLSICEGGGTANTTIIEICPNSRKEAKL